ncbi:pyruvate:ferredoxin (flavodoxin) oxidoreductase [endosymbiont 'TC1' of Trimyema compressum]|uniref:pyruvate:ferredoxin (flavodoxin) oxidoreductase n=1 Tax=endosymbiont 'TC1' of Trimyema compressum TaxID=243899 RepID=UPI0007F12C63|nr:pyruvate:ferredoxin (flavodoxin) oxidoreductase [endosymbiont 'TC1' of Trimyema compressum]AMP21090.1 pyruvate:ferredoxin (flavodoxin) oxidoreductase [endosymbiont 'TC1' of Trimyema compressum]
MGKIKITTDGNGAAAHVAYYYTDVAAIYPITPSSTMAENVDQWSAEGRKNIFGQTVRVTEMQSEAGAAGAVHGSLSAGALTTTFTASQGLLLMIPNMYKIAGELLPSVFHVAARALATHALSIFGDHADVMACRQTGFAMLCGGSVQEVADLSIVAHLASIKGSLPFVNFFDGFRTSHEIQKIEVLEEEDYRALLPKEELAAFRARALNPEHPIVKGTSQNPDVYFQGREASNPFYDKLPSIVVDYMNQVSEITGRTYKPFNYYGHPEAEEVVVVMGSVTEALEETIDYLNAQGRKTGVLKVHLFRPFVKEFFMDSMPKTVRKIAVLDRTKEPGAAGEPLYQEIRSLYFGEANSPAIIGGRYGLGSKDINPTELKSVFDNIEGEMKNSFTVGINDDVTFTSLPSVAIIATEPVERVRCKFWGLGSDGTVGANKSAIKIIGDNTDLYAQGYFSYDSKKSGGVTISHLRFGKEPIKSTYLVDAPNFVSCSQRAYLAQYDVLEGIKENGTFLLNTPWSGVELEEKLPAKIKRILAEKNVNFYTIDADQIAREVGLGNRTNMVMQAAFFKLSEVLPFEEAISLLKESIKKTYGSKGDAVVQMNYDAVDHSISLLNKVEIGKDWANAKEPKVAQTDIPEFIKDVCMPMNKQVGDNTPVSAFKGREDGHFPLGTSAYEKRGIANFVPEWIADKCIQCNQCAFVCPHAVVRAFLLDDEEAKGFNGTLLDAKGKGMEDLKYKIQISPLDCTGCENCAKTCPVGALEMKPLKEEINEQENWTYMMDEVQPKLDRMASNTLKGSQFVPPYLEFSGACAGCGETPYIRLATQLYGDQMIIANATGCSSIWGASAPSTPYCTNKEGKGPAWANSLFEDNAEFGIGILNGVTQRRRRQKVRLRQLIDIGVDEALEDIIEAWINCYEDTLPSKHASKRLVLALEETSLTGEAKVLKDLILSDEDLLPKKSIWIVGGDGWAYDIGYGGLDHVIASGKDVNILVFDTEIYSNTGGQSSKSTPLGAIVKFAAGGKKIRKKDLGLMQMTYGHAYVAQVAMGANRNHLIKVLEEAESHKGPSLIIAYAPCISHGIKGGMTDTQKREKEAVESGYWHLFRYNPNKKNTGENPFSLDSKKPEKAFKDFLMKEVRYTSLLKINKDMAEALFDEAAQGAEEKYQMYRKMDEGQFYF